MSYLRELNKTTKTQQGLIFSPLGIWYFYIQHSNSLSSSRGGFFFSSVLFNCKPALYNSSARCPVQRWPTWSKFIQLCLGIQPILLPSNTLRDKATYPTAFSFFLSLYALIQTVLFPQTVGACTYFFCCLKGGGSDLALLSAMSCVFFIWCECFASPLSGNKHSQMTERGLQKVSLSLPSFNPLDSLTLCLKLRCCTEQTRTSARFTHFAIVAGREKNVVFFIRTRS